MEAMITAQAAAEKVRRTLDQHNFQAFLVGGCVRDLLLGRKPKDFDITTNATPEEVMNLFPKTIPVGAAFGVIVVVEGGHQIEVATFRTDGTYSDARRPDSVSYSVDVREDVQRRDFTINGLLCVGAADTSTVAAYDASLKGASTHITIGDEFNSKTYGIMDHVGGLADLNAKVIRCIGNPVDRFTEDALRMLRAVRFAAQLGFEIEAKTLEAIDAKAPTIKKISKERIAAELFKLVTAPFPVKGLVPLVTTGLANFILPYDGGDFADTLRRFTMFPTPDPLKGIAMLVVNYDYETACTFFNELKLSTEQKDVLEGALHNDGDTNNLDCLTLAELKKLARRPGIQINLDLFEQTVAMSRDTTEPEWAEAIRKLRNFTKDDMYPKPLVTGDDLIAMGLKPGPIFTKLLGALETEQLNGTMTTHATALRFVQELAEREKTDA
jgi:tRNA nucleotidyltransferase/poly(A) polymerase